MPDKLIDAVLSAVEHGSWNIFAVVAAIFIVLRMGSIYEFFERRATKREEFIKDALKAEAVDGVTRTFLEEELNRVLFMKVTRMSADKVLREKVKDLLSKSNGELQVYEMSKASKYLSIKDGKAVIRIDMLDKIFQCGSYILGLLFGLLASLLLASTVSKHVTVREIVFTDAVALGMFGLALFFLESAMPLKTAKRIQPLIERLQSAPQDDCCVIASTHTQRGAEAKARLRPSDCDSLAVTPRR